MHTKLGQTANRIITVGDASRAWLIASHLDQAKDEVEFTKVRNRARQFQQEDLPQLDSSPTVPDSEIGSKPLFAHCSSRGFLTITGTYDGVPVSIVAIGMGVAMMDFFVREVRMVTEGPLTIVRFGSCGGIDVNLKAGQISIATDAAYISRNCDYFITGKGEPYHLSEKISANPQLENLLASELDEQMKDVDPGTSMLPNPRVIRALNVTADSFYSSQGRHDPNFNDQNGDIVALIQKRYPNAGTLEMETFMLYHLSKTARSELGSSISVAACTMIFFERFTGRTMSKDSIKYLEERAGLALLRTVTKFQS